MPPKAILFDLDDTIISFTEGAADCWRDACEFVVDEDKTVRPEALYDAIRRTQHWYWNDAERHRLGRMNLNKARNEIVIQALSEVNISSPALAEKITNYYILARDNVIHLFPEAIETLQILRQKGIKLALVTNGSSVEQWQKINRFQIAPLFDCIVVEGDLGVGKPDERPFLHALQELSVDPHDAWMVGDNLVWDVEGPQKLSIRGIWVDSNREGLPENSFIAPDSIVSSISELVQLIQD